MKDFNKQLNSHDRSLLIVISGPTCSGKDTVMKELLKHNKNMRRLVTTNSRPKRAEEQEGVDYYFIQRNEFEKLIAQEAFYEWVEYRGEYRGGRKKHVREALNSGKDVIWRIDVRGVKNIHGKVKKEFPNSVFIFLTETLEVLKKRMLKRATENHKWKKWSINMAIWELKQYKDFDYLVWNKQDKLNNTIKQIEDIIEAERLKIRKNNG